MVREADLAGAASDGLLRLSHHIAVQTFRLFKTSSIIHEDSKKRRPRRSRTWTDLVLCQSLALPI